MNTFVFTAVGERHVERALIACRCLRRYTSDRIVLLVARADRSNWEEEILVELPHGLTDVQASRFLKTSLHRHVDLDKGLGCYLDSDVLAVSPQASRIFEQKRGEIVFGTDHSSTIRTFSPWALRDVTDWGPALGDFIFEEFDLTVDLDWSLWNGGVYLFDEQSFPFLDDWHNATVELAQHPSLIVRDQVALILTVWRRGLQEHVRLSPQYNWLVRHSGKRGDVLDFNDGMFSFEGKSVHFLHFIFKEECWELAKALERVGENSQRFGELLRE